MSLTPSQEWWTTDEIATSGLPDLPATRQGVDALAARMSWRGFPTMARRRSGRGGGWEYSWRLFPARAQRRLLQAAAPVASDRPARDEAWTWYESLPQGVKDRASARLQILQTVEALEPAVGRHMAVLSVARESGQGARTIWSWFGLVEGVRPDDRLPYLAPRNRARADRPRLRDCDPAFFDALKAAYLRMGEPAFTDAYRDALRAAKAAGWDVLPERTMRRRLDAAVSQPVQVLMRQGPEALKRLYPPQVRDKTSLVAMEGVNADFHKIDVFVRWPGRNGEPDTILRPQIVAFQDLYSGRILSWRVDVSANSTAVLLAAGDMIERWGIPGHVVLDNGREFAAKAITGGTSTRFRFKVKEDDIPGLFTALGCQVHWATPYSGQSKPIERAFRDWAQSVAKDVRFEGAYTGNSPDAKPENYGSRAVPLADFLSVLAERIEEHNSRQGRRSEVAWRRSFAEVFDESYATAPIRKATEAQRRLWLLGAEGLRAHATTGQIAFMGNGFWEPWCHEIAGKRVVIRFDPADLHAGVHIYGADGAYLGHAACREKAGFFDMDEARAHAKARRDWVNAEKRAAEAHRRMTASDLGAILDATAPAPASPPDAKVVRPVFGQPAAVPERPAAPPAGAPVSADVARHQAAIIADLSARRAPVATAPAEETDRERFRRALDLERREATGEVLTIEQARWLAAFQASSAYQAERLLWRDYGDEIFG
ncbi:MAG: Mu transposase C-terminal domain-containing protein [Paracoccaceae bacterium]|nr:MAG: Mu transposase C-terminal domain-containing protein [Paracoccaceae bacterium]